MKDVKSKIIWQDDSENCKQICTPNASARWSRKKDVLNWCYDLIEMYASRNVQRLRDEVQQLKKILEEVKT